MTLAEILARVHRIEILSRSLVRSALAGEYASVFKGRGIEFADVREYTYGDDVRTIDWGVTARMHAAYVRRYVEEREQTVLFVMDCSASTGFGTQASPKIELAAEVCGVLALAAVRNNDRVGAVFFTDRIEAYIPPGKGARHTLRVVREMLAHDAPRRTTDVAAALDYVRRILRRRAVVFIVSDWLDAGYDDALGRLSRRHDVIAVQVVDPRERVLPDVGLMTVWEPESGESRTVDTGSAAVRAQLERRAAEFDLALEQRLRAWHVDMIRLEAGQPYVAPLLSFFRKRARWPR